MIGIGRIAKKAILSPAIHVLVEIIVADAQCFNFLRGHQNSLSQEKQKIGSLPEIP